jgi:hypothetical protein
LREHCLDVSPHTRGLHRRLPHPPSVPFAAPSFNRAIDSLIQKGEIELEEIVKNFKQRHHVLGKYVIEPQYAARDAALPKPNHSAFLSSFYKGA